MLALLFDATPSHAWEAFTDSVTRALVSPGVTTVALALLCMWGKDLLSPGLAAPLTLPSTNISTLGRCVLPTPVLNAAWGSC